jgi:hypothetical protein
MVDEYVVSIIVGDLPASEDKYRPLSVRKIIESLDRNS